MKRVPVDLAMVADALTHSSPDYSNFLDKETGEVILIENHILHLVEEYLGRDMLPEQDEPPDMAFIVEEKRLPQWQESSLQDAYRVEMHFGGRIIRIPAGESGYSWDDMAEFIETVQNSNLADRLRDAIDGRGAFSRFKRVVYDHPETAKKWNAFREIRQQERAAEWLESEGIIAVEKKE